MLRVLIEEVFVIPSLQNKKALCLFIKHDVSSGFEIAFPL